jgi:hypothetical protein
MSWLVMEKMERGWRVIDASNPELRRKFGLPEPERRPWGVDISPDEITAYVDVEVRPPIDWVKAVTWIVLGGALGAFWGWLLGKVL